MVKRLGHLSLEERRGELGEEKAERDLIDVYKYLREGAKQALLSGAHSQDQRQWAQTATQEALPEHKETLFRRESNQALAQVARRSCGGI